MNQGSVHLLIFSILFANVGLAVLPDNGDGSIGSSISIKQNNLSQLEQQIMKNPTTDQHKESQNLQAAGTKQNVRNKQFDGDNDLLQKIEQALTKEQL